MSTWTHVVGSFRIDGMPGLTGEPYAGDLNEEYNIESVKAKLGPMCLFHAWNEDSTLPRGSEGSLQYTVEEYGTGMPWVVVTVWGDLRDFHAEDIRHIKSWWKHTLGKFSMIRDAVLYVKCESEKRPHILTRQGW
jgi:hypothetical protein